KVIPPLHQQSSHHPQKSRAPTAASAPQAQSHQPARRKRPTSPEPKFVTESDLDEPSFDNSFQDGLVRTSNVSNSSWDEGSLHPSNGLKLKRKKVSHSPLRNEPGTTSLYPAQVALSQQLASKRVKDIARKELSKPIRPVRV